MTYILPQVQVFQDFRLIPTAVIKNLNAFVFGPNYQLFRYAEAAEKALISLGAYDRLADHAYAYPNQPGGTTVDQSYVKLYLDNVWAEYINIPAGDANPINVVSPSELNKLRAAPVIADVTNGNAVSAQFGTDTKGWFVGGVALPEYYYFYPTGGANGGATWLSAGYITDLNTGTAPGKLAYITSEDLAGTVSVAVNALTAGVLTPGPDGIQIDFDVGSSPGQIRSATKLSVVGGASPYQILEPNLANVKNIIDQKLDSALPVQINIASAAAPTSAVWSNATLTLTINLNSGGMPSVTALSAVIAAAFAVPGATASTYLTFTTATDAGLVTDVVDNQTAPVTVVGAGNMAMLRDCYRLRVTANPYTFMTGNGIAHSAHFLSRGVMVGDMVRYSVTDDLSVVHTGTTRVVGFESDQTIAAIFDPTTAALNGGAQSGDDLTAALSIITHGVDNQRVFDHANTKLYSLDIIGGGAHAYYPGELSGGLLGDTFIVTITASGLKGVAQATVENASGTYLRENVLIESAGADDGQIYIGRNLVINFKKGAGDADAVFQAGDTYTFTRDVLTAFTAITHAAALVSASGIYEGTQDTTYIVEVVRGGTFARAANVIKGLKVTAGTVLTSTIPVAWLGGDNDDEYVLKCTAAGDIVHAVFSLESQRGDNQAGIVIGAALTDVMISGYGLTVQFSADAAFAAGDYWVIKVNASRPQIQIYDSAGADEGSYEVVDYATDINLGVLGAKINFAANTDREGGFVGNGGLLKGDIFYVAVTASQASALKTLVLADDLSAAITTGYKADGTTNQNPNNVSIWLYLVQAHTAITQKRVQLPPDYNWEPAASDVTVYAGIAVQDSSWSLTAWLPVYRADMYLEYRALLVTLTGSIQRLDDIGLVETTLGTITPDNPLAQGVYNALSNSGDRGVFYIALTSDDLSGYLIALDRATLTQEVYAFAPMTQDAAILNAVEAHINAQSTETEKHWRIGFVSRIKPTIEVVYDLAVNPAHEEYFATITQDPASLVPKYTLVTFYRADGVTVSPYTQVLTDVVVGDQIRIKFSTDAWGDATYLTYTVASLVSNTALKLVAGPAAPMTAVKVEVWHPLTIQEQAEAVAAISGSYDNRRIYNCFPDTLGAYGVLQSGEFGAAAVAGLCSSVPPQQGLTNIQLNGFDDLPAVYSTFSRAQLNTMAERGTLIIMQDVVGGLIYIRHQLSTATADGNINTRELSVTKNLDSISYYFADRLAPFIGRYNITPDLLVVLRTQINDGLLYLGSFTGIGLLGPQLILDNTQLVTLQQHPTLKDTVLAIVNVQVPYPLNVIELHLVV